MHLTILLSHAVQCICSPQEKRGEPQTQNSQNTHEFLMFCAAETRAARCLATKTQCYKLLQIILYLPGKIRVLLTCFECSGIYPSCCFCVWEGEAREENVMQNFINKSSNICNFMCTALGNYCLLSKTCS